MLLYLPEKLYEEIKSDKKYAELESKCSKEIFGDTEIDLVNTLLNYQTENPSIQELMNYLYKKIKKKNHKKLDLLFSDDLEFEESIYKSSDDETKLLMLYEIENGDITMTEEFNDRTLEFIKIYENSTEEFSAYIHILYYMYKLFECLYPLHNEHIFSSENIKKWIDYEQKWYNITYEKLKNEDKAILNILFHKRIQMLTVFFEVYGQFNVSENNYDTMLYIENMIENIDFKYNDFNWFKILFNQMAFQITMDFGDFENAIKYFKKLYSLIIFALDNKKYALKALNHFNKAFLDDFLGYMRFFYIMIERFVPKYHKDFIKKILKMTKMEREFILNETDKETKAKLYMLINTDNAFHINWVMKNKNKFDTLNYIIDKSN